jgi:zona occludens toxin
MPINVYTGLMRSGKSYEVVSMVILIAVLSGRDVVTNVDGISEERIHDYLAKKHPDKDRTKFGRIRHVTNEDVFKPDFLPYYDDVKEAHTDTMVQPGDLVCIDEAWRFWGSDCKLHKHHKSFFLEHGHFTHSETGVACDLVLMIQDMGTLHRFLKYVVAFNFRTHKKVALGMSNTYSVTMWEGYKQSNATQAGNWVRRYNKEIFPLYSSFKGGAQGKMVNADKRQNVFANPRLWGMVALAVAGGGYSFYNIWKFFHPASKEITQQVNVPAGAAQPAKPGQTASTSEKPLENGFSEKWRIVGRFAANGQAWVIVTNAAGRLRVESPSVFHNSGYAVIGEIDRERVTVWTGTAVPGGSALEIKK